MRRLLAALLALLPSAAPAQESAVLLADSLLVTGDERLVATGNVQAFYEGTTLSAARVSYDRATDRLLIEGPILIRDPNGEVLTAERGELDARLEQGLLRGARLVLDRQLQLSANRIDRVEGLTALTGAAVSSCRVCPGCAPLWEIRAEQVIRDEVAQQLYFENARFLIRGVPILWVPRMRLPAPGNERATGLLIPRLRTTDRLGVGIKLPYFVELGPSRDVTLTPYLSAETLTLEARYRQAFLSGDIEVNGAVSRDDLTEEPLRGYLSAEGAFDLGDRLDLRFSGTAVSDATYLSDYGYSDADRLESTIQLSRVGETTLFAADLSAFRSLREDESDGALPPVIGQLSWEKRRDAAGGTLTLGAGIEGFVRGRDGEGPAARDVSRAGGFADWRGDRVLGWGLLLEEEARGAADAWWVADDPDWPDPVLRATPAAAATLRWPLVRQGLAVADLIEPVVSLGWTGALGDDPPNEDARLPELDEANLFALSRLPGEDAVEAGGRLVLGARWSRTAPGFASDLAFGRVLRTEAAEVSEVSGLAGTQSDWLLAGGFELAGGLAFDARALLGEGFDLGKTEARIDWSNAAVSLDAAYVFLPADAFEAREATAHEVAFAAELRPSDRWTVGLDARYDLSNERPARVGLEIGWRSECVEVDVSLARRYTESDDLEPSTSFGLSVNLNGFSAGDRPRVAPGACRG